MTHKPGLTKEQQGLLIRILAAALLFPAALLLAHGPFGEKPTVLVCFLIPYLLVAFDLLVDALQGLWHGQILDESFLLILATAAAFAVQEYEEAVAVALFFQLGELFQSCAISRSRRSIAALMDLRPAFASLEQDGSIREVPPEEVPVGSSIVVKPGERIPLDAEVTEGASYLDTAAITGESVPRHVGVSDTVLSGSVNGPGVLKLRTTRPYADSTVSRILELVENAGSRKAHLEQFITRFARIYTPCVAAAALLLAVVPPLLGAEWQLWLRRACIFLVLSCPCALVLSVPLGFFGGIAAASRRGILIKSGSDLEAVAEITTLVMDKTGTLTEGCFSVSEIRPRGCSSDELLELAALCEAYSAHPIAASVREAYGKALDLSRISVAEEQSGRGIRACLDGRTALLGSAALLQDAGVAVEAVPESGTIVYAALDGQYRGCLRISDRIRSGAIAALEDCRRLGVQSLVLLTGDREQAAREAAAAVGADACYASLLPTEKAAHVESLLAEQQRGKLAFLGDGINDAPVLMRADVGIAMGGIGSDAAIEAADVVIMNDALERLPEAIRIARRTRGVVRANVVLSLGVKGLVLLLGTLGAAGMWAVVFADVGVSILCILNSMRLLAEGEKRT